MSGISAEVQQDFQFERLSGGCGGRRHSRHPGYPVMVESSSSLQTMRH